MTTVERKKPKKKIGVVSSDRMDKSISVRVEYRVKHPLYGKYIRKHIKCTAHDEKNTARTGDKVEIQETRPLSKQKRWTLNKIIEKTV